MRCSHNRTSSHCNLPPFFRYVSTFVSCFTIPLSVQYETHDWHSMDLSAIALVTCECTRSACAKHYCFANETSTKRHKYYKCVIGMHDIFHPVASLLRWCFIIECMRQTNTATTIRGMWTLAFCIALELVNVTWFFLLHRIFFPPSAKFN